MYNLTVEFAVRAKEGEEEQFLNAIILLDTEFPLSAILYALEREALEVEVDDEIVADKDDSEAIIVWHPAESQPQDIIDTWKVVQATLKPMSLSA